LSELLDATAREPVQIEVAAVRVLFELLGFLLKEAIGGQLSAFSQRKITGSFIFPLHNLLGSLPDRSALFRLQ